MPPEPTRTSEPDASEPPLLPEHRTPRTTRDDCAPGTTGTNSPDQLTGELTTEGLPSVKRDFPPEQFFVPGYELLGEVGRGGMGAVYRARDTLLHRDVAVKVLQSRYPSDGDAARRFLDEAGITSQLQHPGIAPIHQVGALTDGRPFLVMKLIYGQTLDALLRSRPDLSHDRGRFLAAFEQICLAVGYAHSTGVIHRDLKPSNIMVGKFGEVQVMDWGLAKVMNEAKHSSTSGGDRDATTIRSLREDGTETVAGSVLGTPSYMPPEQASGDILRIDARSDVFALGSILCTILTGKPSYSGRDTNEVLLKAVRGQTADALARLDACGAEPVLISLAKRCLALEPTDRPADATVVGAAIAEFRSNAEARARQAELERVRAEGELLAEGLKAAEHRKRRKVQRALFVTIALLVCGGGAVAWWRDREAIAAKAEMARRGAQSEAEATAALAEVSSLCKRGEQEIDNPPRWRLALAAARSAHRRAATAVEAGPVSDELLERVRTAEARLNADESDCATAEHYEECAAGYFRALKEARIRDRPAKLQQRIDSVFARVGLSFSNSPPKDVASTIRAHRLRYQLTVLVFLRELLDAEVGATTPYREEVDREIHPLQRDLRESNDPSTVLTEGIVRTMTSAEFLVLAVSHNAAPRGITYQPMLLEEALRRNPADLVALALRGFSGRNGEVKFGDAVRIVRLPDDVKPRPLDERRLEEIVAIANAITIRPDLAVLRNWAGEQLEDTGLYAAAHGRYREALDLEPGRDEVRARLGEVLVKLGALNEALDAYRETLARSPDLTLGAATPFVMEEQRSSLRVRAARAAILLTSAPRPGGALSDEQKRKLRREALGWLRAWLTQGRPTSRELFLVLNDPAFGPVRHPFYLVRLPEAEVDRWQTLWAEIRSTHGTGGGRYVLDRDEGEQNASPSHNVKVFQFKGGFKSPASPPPQPEPAPPPREMRR